MICKSVGVRHTCRGILLGVQLFRLFSKGSAAGALLPLRGKTCQWVKFGKINSREVLHCVGLNCLRVIEPLKLVQGKKKPIFSLPGVLRASYAECKPALGCQRTDSFCNPLNSPLHLLHAGVLSMDISLT